MLSWRRCQPDFLSYLGYGLFWYEAQKILYFRYLIILLRYVLELTIWGQFSQVHYKLFHLCRFQSFISETLIKAWNMSSIIMPHFQIMQMLNIICLVLYNLLSKTLLLLSLIRFHFLVPFVCILCIFHCNFVHSILLCILSNLFFISEMTLFKFCTGFKSALIFYFHIFLLISSEILNLWLRCSVMSWIASLMKFHLWWNIIIWFSLPHGWNQYQLRFTFLRVRVGVYGCNQCQLRSRFLRVREQNRNRF